MTLGNCPRAGVGDRFARCPRLHRGINAAAESFWALLKDEIGTRIRPGRATARAEVFSFIETFCNRRRLRTHRPFGYLTPTETRQRHLHALAA